MTKTEINQAIALAEQERKRLTDWIVNHHSNPYIREVAQKVRDLQAEELRLTKLENDTYPSLEEVNGAQHKQIMIWYRHIPAPRNEAEEQIMDRITERIQEYTNPASKIGFLNSDTKNQ